MAPWSTAGRFSNNIFGPIRLGLALLVVFSHSYLLTHGSESTEPLMVLTGELSFGALAVDMFFATSGFLISRSLESSPTLGSFTLKRVLRIYPAFVVIMVLQAFLLAPLAIDEPFRGYSYRQLGLIAFETANLVGYGYPYGGLLSPFQGVPHPGVMNESLWSIRYEFVCYFILAGTGILFRKLSIWLVLTSLVIGAFYIGWNPPWHRIFTAILGGGQIFPRLLSFFLAGALAYRIRDRLPHSTHLAAVSIAAITVCVIFWPRGLRLSLPVAGTYLLLWLAYHPVLVRLPRPCIGDYSYGVYLYAYPIQQSLMFWVAPRMLLTPLGLATIGGILSVGAGAISWHLVEKPFLSLKPKNARAISDVDNQSRLAPDCS